MADEPIEALGGKTPMQYAKTPYMDKLAELGVTGQMKTVADGFHPMSMKMCCDSVRAPFTE